VLNVDNAYAFLSDRGLVGPTAVLDGDLEITSSTRRNRNLQVKSDEACGYVIKQPEAQATDAQETLRREIGFYRFCHDEPEAAPVRALLPRLILGDVDDVLLVMELVPRSIQLWRHYETSGAAAFPVAAARDVGAALGLVHRTFAAPRLLHQVTAAGLSDAPPAPLSLAYPSPEMRSYTSPGSLEIIRRVQAETELVSRLDAIASRWTATTVVHGDVKLDNILLQDAATAGADPSAQRIYLVDWELVQRGDPAWDVAGALRDFIFFWIIFMPHDLEPDDMAAQAKFPLAVLQPAIQQMWNGYRAAAGRTAPASAALLDRAIDYAGVRMIRTALDLSATFTSVPAPAELLLRVATNLLADPATARSELFGLTEDETPA
jgi:aminoglycoside phosphotransferase (APT) family kinase protein